MMSLQVPSEPERIEMTMINLHVLKALQYISEESKKRLKALSIKLTELE